jgi:hypothetical protein
MNLSHLRRFEAHVFFKIQDHKKKSQSSGFKFFSKCLHLNLLSYSATQRKGIFLIQAYFSYESPPQTPPRTQKLHGEDKVNRSQIVFGSEPTELKETPARRQKAFAYVT